MKQAGPKKIECEKLQNMHLKAVFLLIFSQMGLQPSVARVSEYYIKTFDFEMLTTSYFINETKLIENRQNVIVTKKKNHVLKPHMVH